MSVLGNQVVSPDRSAVADTATLRLHAHLKATLAWLKAAQDSQSDGGVSAIYTPFRGWHPSYPETTGYLIPTIVNAWLSLGDQDYLDRSLIMARWLLGLQNPDGSFSGGVVVTKTNPSVFNTGQILFGLVRIYQVTGEARYLDSACRAGNWLASVQDHDGAWRRHDYLGKTHTYNTRTAWALLLLHGETGDIRFSNAAVANLRWAVCQADATGFFSNCEFDPQPNGRPYGFRDSLHAIFRLRNWPSFFTTASLHTIAYTIQGMLEAAWMMNDKSAELCAVRTASILRAYMLEERLAGFYSEGWKAVTSSRCLTGMAQMCVIWARLHQMGHDGYLEPVDKACDILQRCQDTTSNSPAVKGALAGSEPVRGLYLPFRYPNWAAKFWADALLLLLSIRSRPDLSEQIKTW